MKYHSTLPASAVVVYLSFLTLQFFEILPDQAEIIDTLQQSYDQFAWLLLFLIILVESIIYVGFYFPGQLLAVLIIVLSDGSIVDLVMLTLISILAVTISAGINYGIGYWLLGRHQPKNNAKIQWKELVLAMIHINIIALYVYKQGAERKTPWIIFFTGLLNLPYYVLIVFGTYFLREEIKFVAENDYILLSLLGVWLFYGLFKDLRRHKLSR